jgi:predicted DNA-binding transcriptional regulator AlpA
MNKSTSVAAKGYWNTKHLAERYSCSTRTIFRWMKKEECPFPQPRLLAAGSPNLWAIDDVESWELSRMNSAA